jgi:adenylate cyclase
VDFSSRALEAGDAKALDLLRAVGRALEPPIEEHGGQIVKRLGDGLLRIFFGKTPIEVATNDYESRLAT